MTRWLTQDELAAWLPLAGVMLRFNSALDSQLVRDSDLTHFDYLCLAMLSEEPGHVTSMSMLAGRTNASLSRLSHVISKLERRGLVTRCPSDVSKRVTNVRMTEQGYAVLVAAAPGHVEHVRSLIFDGLTDEDVAALRRLMLHMLGQHRVRRGQGRPARGQARPAARPRRRLIAAAPPPSYAAVTPAGGERAVGPTRAVSRSARRHSQPAAAKSPAYIALMPTTSSADASAGSPTTSTPRATATTTAAAAPRAIADPRGRSRAASTPTTATTGAAR